MSVLPLSYFQFSKDAGRRLNWQAQSRMWSIEMASDGSGFENIIVMPLEKFGGGLVDGVRGEADSTAMVAVVVAAVIELFFDAAADFDVHVRGDGDVALVEQGV